MDLLSIFRAIWRHKLMTIPVILLTAVAAFYVVAIKAPVYEASSSLLLMNPPGPPTAAQIAANPKLGKINANNPYMSYGNLTMVADVVINLVTDNSNAQHLIRAGADPRYQVALSTELDTPPIIQVTGVASSPEEAIRSANLVTAATKANLYQMQEQVGVNRHYAIGSLEIVRPEVAIASYSGKLRTLIAVLALGVILLFVTVSVADVIERRRKASATSSDMPRQSLPEDNRRSQTWEKRQARPLEPRRAGLRQKELQSHEDAGRR